VDHIKCMQLKFIYCVVDWPTCAQIKNLLNSDINWCE
jgi:hypothetical protein